MALKNKFLQSGNPIRCCVASNASTSKSSDSTAAQTYANIVTVHDNDQKQQ